MPDLARVRANRPVPRDIKPTQRKGRAMMDTTAFDFNTAYTAQGWSAGIAWRAYALETEPDEDTEWTGIENETGRVLAHMIGDDRTFSFDPEDLTPIGDDDYCSGCGQVGCGWC